MTEAERQRFNTYHREIQRKRYHLDPEYRRARIDCVMRCAVKKPAAALSAEQLAKRRASDAERQARYRAAKKAAATATP
jgi:hypothetical protein